MSSNEFAIRVEGLCKTYQIYERPQDRLRQSIYPRLQRLFGRKPKRYYRDFPALHNVSLEIRRGETIGIIGRNGSGKSTLLQIICGTLSPTSGMVTKNGRVAALLELGSGFNHEFTGRENVYLNATLLGLSKKEISQRLDSIVAFADIGDFLDQPVKTYSSGMFVRLAFSVIAHVDADILIIDEALSVGDIFFQQKCMRFLSGFRERGGTLLFVSHDTAAVTGLCEKAYLLGKNVYGEAKQIIDIYLEDFYAARSATLEPRTAIAAAIESANISLPDEPIKYKLIASLESSTEIENLLEASPFNTNAEGFGTGGASITDVWFECPISGNRISRLEGGRRTRLVIQAKAERAITQPAIGIMINDRLGQKIFAEGTYSRFHRTDYVLNPYSSFRAIFEFDMPILAVGDYSVAIAFAEGVRSDDHIQLQWLHDALIIKSIQSHLVHGICGLQQLKMEIQESTT